MSNFYKINIPEPCNENWDKMIANENGRHCNSCSKTVVDFTRMSPLEIQNYLQLNVHEGVCGRFKQEDLDIIKIYVPKSILEKQVTFQKVFLLALLICMGTMLFSCTSSSGEKQQISEVEIVENFNAIEKSNDSHKILDCGAKSIEIQQKNDTIASIPKPPMKVGIIAHPPLMGEPALEPVKPAKKIFYIDNVDTVPRFKGTTAGATNEEAIQLLQNGIACFVKEKMDKKPFYPLSIFVQYEINAYGNIENVETHTFHKIVEKRVREIILMLPKFTPAKYNDENVGIRHMFQIKYQAK